jgi:hypothetical protein
MFSPSEGAATHSTQCSRNASHGHRIDCDGSQSWRIYQQALAILAGFAGFQRSIGQFLIAEFASFCSLLLRTSESKGHQHLIDFWSMIRKNVQRSSLATNAKRLCAEIMLKQGMRS